MIGYPGIVVSFLAGAITSVAMVMAAFRLYVEIENPYLVYAVAFIVFELAMTALRHARRNGGSLLQMTRTSLLEAAFFVAGAAAAFFGLMSIYPPNFV